MSRLCRILAAALALPLALSPCGCQREQRNFRPAAPFARAIAYESEIEGNAFALSEGKRLFYAFNCSGCHANGGGGIGPPLMDSEWLYGHEPDAIFTTIARGRPNGMPAFGGKVPPY